MPSLLRWMYSGLIPMCNVCKNMTWGERKSSFALQQQTRSPAAPTECHHNQIPVLQVGVCRSQRDECECCKLISNFLIQLIETNDSTQKLGVKMEENGYWELFMDCWVKIYHPDARVQDYSLRFAAHLYFDYLIYLSSSFGPQKEAIECLIHVFILQLEPNRKLLNPSKV